MKKLLLALVVATALSFSVQTTLVSANDGCQMDEPYTRVATEANQVYEVGEAFRTKGTELIVYNGSGWQVYKDSQLEFRANGVQISEGYKFKEPGKKIITVKHKDQQAQYELQVIPDLKGTIKECYIMAPPAKLTYRQSVEPFDPKDVVIKCIFTNGTTQDIHHGGIEFYAGGKQIKKGYRFREPGEKTLEIKLADYSIQYKLTVTPTFTTKAVSRCEMLTEPTTMKYKVGQGFRASEYAVRCYYTDGTFEDFNHERLDITANGVSMYEGYAFVQSGEKNIAVHLGDYSIDYKIYVK